MNVEVVEHETPSGRSTYAVWRPPAHAWVQLVWYSEGVLEHLRERILPSATIELVLNLGPPIVVAEGLGTEVLRAGCTGGLSTRPTVLAHPRVHRAVGLRLHPLAVHALTRQPLAPITDYFVTLDELIGREAEELVERCHAAPTIAACLSVAFGWLERRLAGTTIDPIVQFTAAELERHRGGLSLAALRDRTGVGKTRFVHCFREAIGVTPKTYARLLRFSHALSLLDTHPRSLADLALKAGYYDQPHMNGEFRELAGFSPRELIGTRYPGGFTIPED